MNWAAQIRARDRETFSVEHPHPFLFGVTLVVPPRGSSTLHGRQVTVGAELPGDAPVQPRVLVRAVRKWKREPGQDGDISLGRTDANDIVLEDVQVSKLHALFVVEGGRVLLQD